MGVVYEYEGCRRSVAELSTMSGISPEVIRRRIKSGWSVEKAISTPVKEAPARTGKGESEAQFKVVFTVPVPEVFREMQPKLNKVYVATQHNLSKSKKSHRDFYTITLENGDDDIKSGTYVFEQGEDYIKIGLVKYDKVEK